VIASVGDVLVEVAEAAGWVAGLVDRRCQTKITNKRMQADTSTARRTRIPYHSMGTATSQEGTVKPESMREKGMFVAWWQASTLRLDRKKFTVSAAILTVEFPSCNVATRVCPIKPRPGSIRLFTTFFGQEPLTMQMLPGCPPPARTVLAPEVRIAKMTLLPEARRGLALRGNS